MLLAIDKLDPVVQGIFFLVALILFLLAAVGTRAGWPWHPSLIALGLAFFTVPFMWNAFAAA